MPFKILLLMSRPCSSKEDYLSNNIFRQREADLVWKTFVMYDCTSGNILDFVVYTEANSDINAPGLGKAADTVATLTTLLTIL